MRSLTFAAPVEPDSRPCLWILIPARCVGALFLATGVAKLPVFMEFAHTVAERLQSGPAVSTMIAAVVVVAEIAGGGMLLSGRRVRQAALLLGLLTVVFLWALYPGATGGTAFTCNCFGMLGIHLSNQTEFLADLGIFTLLGLAAFSRPRSEGAIRRADSTARMLAAALPVFLIAAAAVLIADRQTDNGLETGSRRIPESPDFRPALLYAGGLPALTPAGVGGREGAPARTMMFLLSFSDFTCSVCFEDFISLSDSLGRGGINAARGRVLALMKEGGAERLHGNDRLHRWAEWAGLPFPVSFAPDSLFTAMGFRKSMAAVLDVSGRTLFHAEFPMGPERRREAIRLLAE